MKKLLGLAGLVYLLWAGGLIHVTADKTCEWHKENPATREHYAAEHDRDGDGIGCEGGWGESAAVEVEAVEDIAPRVMLSETPEAWIDCSVLLGPVKYPQAANEDLSEVLFWQYIVFHLIVSEAELPPKAQEFVEALSSAADECESMGAQ